MEDLAEKRGICLEWLLPYYKQELFKILKTESPLNN